jgi:hypothetical protein
MCSSSLCPSWESICFGASAASYKRVSYRLILVGFFVSTSVHHSVYKPENECSAFCLALKLALGKHLGTIFAASFVNVFLFLPSVIYGDLRSCLGAKFYKAGCCGALFDLVRSDAISYSVLTGNPYCNSAKYCEYLWY